MGISKRNIELLTKYSESLDREVLEEIMLVNDKLNYLVANKYKNSNVDFEDIVSIARWGMLKAIKTFDVTKKASFSTYAVRCMANEVLQHYRRDKKHWSNMSMEQPIGFDNIGNEILLEDALEADVDILGDILDLEEVLRVRDIVKSLRKRDRAVLELRFFKNMTQREVAKELGLSQTQVNRDLKRALKTFKIIYEREW